MCSLNYMPMIFCPFYGCPMICSIQGNYRHSIGKVPTIGKNPSNLISKSFQIFIGILPLSISGHLVQGFMLVSRFVTCDFTGRSISKLRINTIQKPIKNQLICTKKTFVNNFYWCNAALCQLLLLLRKLGITLLNCIPVIITTKNFGTHFYR